MANKTIEDLTAQVTKATTVEKSAELLINGFQSRLDAAVAAAIANGATAEELAPLTELSTAMEAESDALAAAVSANTQAA
jgi:hypothetical protein